MPNWLNDAVFYEIYPQSFKDTNADGIGDFKGILEKLDYIKELGCNAVWMNPCFASPFLDAGYDVSDYYTAAPRYGTNEDLKQIFVKAHELGMHVILDLVPGHTSVEHPWFRESMKAAKNEFTDRYIWTNDVWEAPEGMGSLRGISEREGACAVNFFSHQPALNYGYYRPQKPWQQAVDAPGPQATIAEMKNVMRFWLQMGCDGFRVDMAGSLVKGDEDGKGTIRLWQDVRAFLDREFPEAAIVSEWGEPDKSLLGGFHMDFLLHFGPSHYNDLFRCEEPYFSSRGKGDASAFVAKYCENYKKTGGKGLICIPSGNHDMDRLARTLTPEEMRIAFAFLLSMPGAPFIYYGDEIGMRYVEGLPSVEGGYNRTGARSPMQWDDTANAGFSAAPKEKMYIPLDGSEDRPTVKAQMADDGSLYHEVRRLITLRRAHKALLADGEIAFLNVEAKTDSQTSNSGTDLQMGLDGAYPREDARQPHPLVYMRSCEQEKILVIINPAGKEQTFPCELLPTKTIYTIGDAARFADGVVTVPPCHAGYYLL